MKETLERLSEITAPVCVTLILNTHRTTPENQKDIIALKNLISETYERLQREHGSDIAKRYTAKLQGLAEDIDHYHNDHGLMLFVNDEIAEYLRLPIHVTDRVIIDKTFATRSIVRAMKRVSDYYVLVLSKGKARLIEASGDVVVKEVRGEGFPFNDSQFMKLSSAESSNAARASNLAHEFFNRVDKALNKIRNENPLPVVVCAEESNYHLYLAAADHPNIILGHVLLKNIDASPNSIVKDYVAPQVEEMTLLKHRERISELSAAVNSGRALTDLNEIWAAVRVGRGKTIFVEQGYIQAVRKEDGLLKPIALDEVDSKEDINDVVDEMIEHTMKMGGDVVFVRKGDLEQFNKLALATRY
ncbi:MAG TPA: hypothetical protein PLR24_00605 [Saprospiraceae bacterium]|nr:hypothetical protein [Saprospiraceae bacterium]